MSLYSKLYDLPSVNNLLGCLLLDPTLCLNDKYKLDLTDFYDPDIERGFQFQRLMYGAINNLATQGFKVVEYNNIGDYMIKWRPQYKILEENNYMDFCTTYKKLSSVENVQGYYNNVRKMSLLAEYVKNGYDIKKFYNIDGDEDKERAKLESITLEKIINYFDGLQCDIKRKYLLDDEDTTRKKAGDNGKIIFKKFEESPIWGLNFESKYLTTLWGGWRKKQMYIRSGDTSSGKSRNALGDLYGACVDELYDSDTQTWIKNTNGKNRGLYIGCEMSLDEEVDPIGWAYVSDVDSSKITEGTCTDEEKERVNRAIDNINDDCIWLTDMPSFNIQKLEDEIKTYKVKHNIDFVAFDYMLLNTSLVREFVQNRGSGIGSREDSILLELSKSLKDICKKYDVGLLTSTQVNADIKDFRNRDYQVLRGGKAVADKATGGSISMPITQQELKLIEPYLEKKGFGDRRLRPNFVETVYKSRFSKYPKECKIFSYYNLGTMRKKELFVTDKDFKPIDVKRTIIERNDDNE